MSALSTNLTHYAEMAEQAQAIAILNQMRVLIEAHRASGQAERLLSHQDDDTVEHLAFAARDEKVRLLALLDAAGIEMGLLREAII